MARTRLDSVTIDAVAWLKDDPRVLDVAKRAAPKGNPRAFGVLENHVDDPSVRDLIIKLSSRRNDAGESARAIVDKYNLKKPPRRKQP